MNFLKSFPNRFAGLWLVLMLTAALSAWGQAEPAGGGAAVDSAGVDSLAVQPAVQPVRSGPDSALVDSTAGGLPIEFVPVLPGIPFFVSPFDTVSYREYVRKQSFSLDHFLETAPGFVIGRRGPIGADAVFSRFGIGSGRGTVYMAGLPINDPQNDLAPLSLLPVSTIQSLVYDPAWSGRLPGRADMEGVVSIVERGPDPDRPMTTLELSKGSNLLRQRRVRFSSARSKVGLDLGYDELLNSGYQFDARERTGGWDYGSSFSRFHTVNLRGELPNDQSYLFSFRWFKDAFQGDLSSFLAERRRSGHYAVLSTALGSWRLLMFQRNYDVSLPDSHTVNHTSAAYVSTRPFVTGNIDTEIGIGLENIDSEQTIGGADSDHILRRGSLGGSAVLRLRDWARARGELNLGHHMRGRSGWGGRLGLALRPRANHELAFELARSFRLPNLGERFLPLHSSPAAGIDRIVGNRYLDPETTWEAGVRLRFKLGFVKSETRLTSIQARDAILFRTESHGGETWLVPGNVGRDRISVLDERLAVVTDIYGIELRLNGGLVHIVGDRTGYFSAAPETRLDAVFSLDRDMFQETSGIRLAAEVQYSSDRLGDGGAISPAYTVMNLKVEARLLEAHLFIHWLNLTDETYTTLWPYLMTPRTFVYGIQWTLFN